MSIFRRIWSWQPDQNSPWVIFIRRTEIDGLTQAVSPDIHISVRIFYLTAFISCSFLSIYLICDSVLEFMKHPILYAFPDEISVENIPFPGLSFTGPNLLHISQFNKADKIYEKYAFLNQSDEDGTFWSDTEASILIHFLDHICESAKSFLKSFTAIHPFKSLNLKDYKGWVLEQNITLIDNPNDPAFKEKILPFVQKGMMNCSVMFAACKWRGSKVPCPSIIKPQQTDVGMACSFNRMPNKVLIRSASLQWAMNDHDFPVAELERWKKWDIETDKKLQGNQILYDFDLHGIQEKYLDTNKDDDIPRRQHVAGLDNGFSVMVNFENEEDMGCPTIDGSAYMVTVHPPHEQPQIRTQGIPIPPNSEVFIQIKAVVTLADERVEKLDLNLRRCYYNKENPLKYFSKYTADNCRSECLSTIIFAACKCFQLSLPGGYMQKICGPLDNECVENITKKVETIGFGRACPNPKCYPPCTQITYHQQSYVIPYNESKITNSEVLNMQPNQKTSIVHVYFITETMETRERTRQYDWAQLLGLIGGIWGLTIGLCIIRTVSISIGLGFAMYQALKWGKTWIPKKDIRIDNLASANQSESASGYDLNPESNADELEMNTEDRKPKKENSNPLRKYNLRTRRGSDVYMISQTQNQSANAINIRNRPSINNWHQYQPLNSLCDVQVDAPRASRDF